MSSENRFFLGRSQKIFGPLSAAEIETLERSGQLSSYTWILKEGDPHWTPIDPPPALPSELRTELRTGSRTHEPAAQEPAARPALRLVPQPSVLQETFRVVLFDPRNAISGWLVNANDGGCELHSDQNGADPLFVVKEAAFLSLHDTRSGETIKLHVRISSVARTDGRGWAYRVRWQAAPSFLSRSSPSNPGESHEVAA